MKTALVTALLFLASFHVANAQVRIRSPRETAERSVENRANNRVDRGIDRGLDKVEEGIGGIFKKKDKKKKKGNADSEAEDAEETENSGEATETKPAPPGKPAAKGGKPAAGSSGSASPSFRTHSKFDFVPGEKVLAFDDFATTSVGDFPLGWNTNSTAEIVTLDGDAKKWLFMSKDGFFTPEYVKNMPENFTLEFDVFTRYSSSNILAYSFYLSAVDNPKKELSNEYIQNGLFFEWRPCVGSGGYILYEKGEKIGNNDGLNIKQFESDDCAKPVMAKISIWRQKTRLRMYVNENKILDIPQAFDAKLKYNSFKFRSVYMNYANGREQNDEFMVANVRYAVGAPDMRSKLITDGKLVTRGITFDVGSDKIKPESYGVLKEIAQVLSENPAVKVKIIGHTDSDGSAASNLELSKKRAAAVSQALTSEFRIDASRMQTDGKGAAEPSEPNTTPQGKANNRRVEFIKL